MSRFSETVRDERGHAIPNVAVYVYEWDYPTDTTGALSALIDDDDVTALPNPLTTDEFGQFYFNADIGLKMIELHYGGKLQYREQIILTPAGVYPGNDAALRTDLAADGGDALIRVKRAEAGAVARSLQDKLRDRISVKDFGAVGDGSTDDTAAFNAAHTAAAAMTSVVYVPSTVGQYRIAGTIVAKAPMFGDGEATVLKTSSASADVIQIGVPNITIGDLQIQQSVTRTGGYYINFNGPTPNSNYNSRVERCTFTNWHGCVGFNSVGAINTVRINDCFMTTNVAGGIGVAFNLTAQGVDIMLRDLFIIGTIASQPSAAVKMGHIGDITLDHVSTVYCGTALNIVPTTGQTTEAVFVNDCLFDSGTGPGISVNPASGATVSLVKVENTWSCTNTHGMLLTGAGFIQRIEVASGYFCNNAAGHGISASVVQYLDVDGGTFAANINGIDIAAGLTNFKIRGAKCGPAGLFAANSGLGISIAAGASSGFLIVNNDLTGNTGGALSNGATGPIGIIVNNLGVNPGATGTITVGASPFTYTAGYSPETVYVASGTVSSIVVNGQNIGLISGAVRLGPKQSVVITYSSAPTMVKSVA